MKKLFMSKIHSHSYVANEEMSLSPLFSLFEEWWQKAPQLFAGHKYTNSKLKGYEITKI